MRPPRAATTLVPLEGLAVLTVAAAPLTSPTAVALALLLIGSMSRWWRRRSWAEHMEGGAQKLAVAALCGVIALVAAAPAITAFGVSVLDWWLLPALRGDAVQLALAALLVVATAVAMELALRGWILERALELSPGPPTFAIGLAALAEAIVVPGPLASRIGAGMFGVGLGMLYSASGRNLLVPVVARATFAAAAVAAAAVGMVN